ncbi:transcriptional regulator, XRE family with cupin sensor [Kushneria avicenniae]|uniref:Transcriptional regulator, XRE family with cupin sensor n=1 Tax=Kushneria avicenniae TaxID=402385 RepID=A0A1I1KEM8_9GAMM|nr:XRE family transcriptional regulator [Kushneria avicenniae]SFC59259.1 transcriptional regulator, XRE family with cupin sensor [Kushneria avicenniae]
MNDASTRRLGERIALLRRHRAWSLSFLAEQAGIAKSSLSRIEQGMGNPTLDTLWRLALQLEIPFSALMASTQSTVTEADISVALLDRHHTPQPVDIYLMTLAPKAQRRATAHAAGTRETLQVIAGNLRAGTENDLATLEVQDVHRFPADQPHAYLAGAQGATALITIFYPDETMS